MLAHHPQRNQTNMRGSTTLLFPILLLAGLAILTYWVNLNVQPPAPKSNADTRHDPDYFLNHFETTQTDIDGGIRYKLKADQMKHYPDDDSTDLVKPFYTQFDQGKKYVEVEGDIGEVSKKAEDIKLYKNVVLTRQPYGDKGLMTLESEYLNILPEEDMILTQKPVVIKQAPKTVVHGTGMVYNKKKKLMTLLHKVRVHYEKPVARPKNHQAIETLNNNNATSAEISRLQKKVNEAHNLPSTRNDKPK